MPALDFWYIARAHGDEDDEYEGRSVVYRACSGGRYDLLKRLGPDPEQEDFDELYGCTTNARVIELLAHDRLLTNPGRVFWRQISSLNFDSFRYGLFLEYWRRPSPDAVRALFKAGVSYPRKLWIGGWLKG